MYFVTICTKNRECILSESVEAHICEQIELKKIGKIVEKEIYNTNIIRKNVKINEYVIMPKWQRNYYEQIIRNEKGLYKNIEYIKNKPLNWENDSNRKQYNK